MLELIASLRVLSTPFTKITVVRALHSRIVTACADDICSKRASTTTAHRKSRGKARWRRGGTAGGNNVHRLAEALDQPVVLPEVARTEWRSVVESNSLKNELIHPQSRDFAKLREDEE